jgi:hypothetical protein
MWFIALRRLTLRVVLGHRLPHGLHSSMSWGGGASQPATQAAASSHVGKQQAAALGPMGLDVGVVRTLVLDMGFDGAAVRRALELTDGDAEQATSLLIDWSTGTGTNNADAAGTVEVVAAAAAPAPSPEPGPAPDGRAASIRSLYDHTPAEFGGGAGKRPPPVPGYWKEQAAAPAQLSSAERRVQKASYGKAEPATRAETSPALPSSDDERKARQQSYCPCHEWHDASTRVHAGGPKDGAPLLHEPEGRWGVYQPPQPDSNGRSSTAGPRSKSQRKNAKRSEKRRATAAAKPQDFAHPAQSVLRNLATLEGDGPVVVWLRQDLRLNDHAALRAAQTSGRPVIPLYIRSPEAEEGGWPMGGAVKLWLHHALRCFDEALRTHCSSRLVLRDASSAKSGTLTVLGEVCQEVGARAVSQGPLPLRAVVCGCRRRRRCCRLSPQLSAHPHARRHAPTLAHVWARAARAVRRWVAG